jgi:hypothetical protein
MACLCACPALSSWMLAWHQTAPRRPRWDRWSNARCRTARSRTSPTRCASCWLQAAALGRGCCAGHICCYMDMSWRPGTNPPYTCRSALPHFHLDWRQVVLEEREYRRRLPELGELLSEPSVHGVYEERLPPELNAALQARRCSRWLQRPRSCRCQSRALRALLRYPILLLLLLLPLRWTHTGPARAPAGRLHCGGGSVRSAALSGRLL